MKTFLPTLILAIGCGINAVQAGRLRSYDAEEETSLLRGRMLQTSMSLSTIDAQPLKGAATGIWTDGTVEEMHGAWKKSKNKSKKMKSKKMKSKKITSKKEPKKGSWKKEAPKKWSWKKEAPKKWSWKKEAPKKMKSKKLSKKKKSNKMKKSAPKKKSKMKSNKSPMKSSKIDKLIELKTELGQLFLVASGIATPEEVEDMSLGELLGMMAFALKGSLPNDEGRLLKDVAEGVGMDMDTVTDLLKEMLQDMI